MNKRILSFLLAVACCMPLSCQVFADNSPYGYLTNEEINALENDVQSTPPKTNNSNTYNTKEIITEELFDSLYNQIEYYFDNGYYLEAMALIDDINTKYDIPQKGQAMVLAALREGSRINYEHYLKTLQRYTYRVPGWGMNITYRGDMSPNLNDYDGSVNLYDYDESDEMISIDSYQIGEKTDLGITVKNAKQLVDEIIKDEQAFYKERNTFKYEYGMKYDVLSANNTTVSGIPAYQAVRRLSFYENRYWTEASYWITKKIAFQYGQWIYVLEASEAAYNWSDDFWNAMEVVINGISFS